MKQAYYAATLASFLKEQPETVLGHLAAQHAHSLDPLQRNAWVEQITLLQNEQRELGDGWIALEFAIPRMGKRVDTIIIRSGIVFVIEFKMGTKHFDASAIDQVTDYALDLKNFHAGSHVRRLVPILVATKADHVRLDLEWSSDGVAKPLLSNESDLGGAIRSVVAKTPNQDAFDPEQWAASGYKPTPTIIEAAQALYQGHRVEEITRSDAGAKNLSETTTCLEKIIEEAKAKRHKAICLVTGVPGAGKTLAGLNLVTGGRTYLLKNNYSCAFGPLSPPSAPASLGASRNPINKQGRTKTTRFRHDQRRRLDRRQDRAVAVLFAQHLVGKRYLSQQHRAKRSPHQRVAFGFDLFGRRRAMRRRVSRLMVCSGYCMMSSVWLPVTAASLRDHHLARCGRLARAAALLLMQSR
jgi:Uncharacterized conserved protein (DUF2075)